MPSEWLVTKHLAGYDTVCEKFRNWVEMAITSDAVVTPDPNIVENAVRATLVELCTRIEGFQKRHAGNLSRIRLDGKLHFGEDWGYSKAEDPALGPLRKSLEQRLAGEEAHLRLVFCTLQQEVDSCIRLLQSDLALYFHARQQGQQKYVQALGDRVREGLEKLEETRVREAERNARRRLIELREEFQQVLVDMEDEPSPRKRRCTVDAPRKTLFLPFNEDSKGAMLLPDWRFATGFELPDIESSAAHHTTEVR